MYRPGDEPLTERFHLFLSTSYDHTRSIRLYLCLALEAIFENAGRQPIHADSVRLQNCFPCFEWFDVAAALEGTLRSADGLYGVEVVRFTNFVLTHHR